MVSVLFMGNCWVFGFSVVPKGAVHSSQQNLVLHSLNGSGTNNNQGIRMKNVLKS